MAGRRRKRPPLPSRADSSENFAAVVVVVVVRKQDSMATAAPRLVWLSHQDASIGCCSRVDSRLVVAAGDDRPDKGGGKGEMTSVLLLCERKRFLRSRNKQAPPKRTMPKREAKFLPWLNLSQNIFFWKNSNVCLSRCSVRMVFKHRQDFCKVLSIIWVRRWKVETNLSAPRVAR